MFILLHILVVYFARARADIVEDVSRYFESAAFNTFHNVWEPQRKLYEEAIEQLLKNGYGKDDQLSMFAARPLMDIPISEGLFVDDNVATVLFSDLHLQQLPQLLDSKVSFAFASNTLDVASQLWKMIITANYEVFIEDQQKSGVQDPYRTSPFASPQVKRLGNVTIIAEECKVSGHVLTRLHNILVVLGHDTFQVSDCIFTVEITSSESAGPPVIAPYFNTKHARVLEKLLTKPIRQELRVALQGAMYLYINSSAILGFNEKAIKDSQRDIFNKTNKALSKFANMANEKTIADNRIATEIKPLTIVWNNMDGQTEKLKVRFSDVTLYGLDSLYSAHVGGPLKQLDTLIICDTLRFASLFVRGQIILDKNVDVRVFVAELKDVELRLDYNVKSSSLSIETVGWRTLEVSLINSEDSPQRSVVVGYIHSKLASTVENHLKTVYQISRSAK
ncbi:uncharacterized protein LOC121733227 [Aricia agestis]|uniref:uncharacterized protein LOC121733227 n=1 Tax=Aricia agestis TaxID=91739 RepID=UPI001C20BE66|nr:uncharacterized protein LOC121733227 [Aricia agestis]